MATKIEWCVTTWNPITGCTPISDGCKNCYAQRMAKRLAGRYGYPKDNPFKPGTVHPDQWSKPAKWKKVRKIFVSSMGDLFHSCVDCVQIYKVFKIASENNRHIFIFLTKRPEMMAKLFENAVRGCCEVNFTRGIPENIWLGVTVESNQYLDRVRTLIKIPASVKFINVEPMLGEIDIGGFVQKNKNGESWRHNDSLNWVICGTESGPRRRSAKIQWIRDLKNQCVEAEIPFFLKQMEIDGKVARMPKLDGQIWEQYPKKTS